MERTSLPEYTPPPPPTLRAFVLRALWEAFSVAGLLQSVGVCMCCQVVPFSEAPLRKSGLRKPSHPLRSFRRPPSVGRLTAVRPYQGTPTTRGGATGVVVLQRVSVLFVHLHKATGAGAGANPWCMRLVCGQGHNQYPHSLCCTRWTLSTVLTCSSMVRGLKCWLKPRTSCFAECGGAECARPFSTL